MPSKKIIVVSIICLGLISVKSGFLNKIPAFNIPTLNTNSQNSLTSENSSSTNSSSVNWQKILSNTQGSTTIATGLNTTTSNYNQNLSMTDQLAQNFFGQYLDAQGQANQSGVDTSAVWTKTLQTKSPATRFHPAISPARSRRLQRQKFKCPTKF